MASHSVIRIICEEVKTDLFSGYLEIDGKQSAEYFTEESCEGVLAFYRRAQATYGNVTAVGACRRCIPDE